VAFPARCRDQAKQALLPEATSREPLEPTSSFGFLSAGTGTGCASQRRVAKTAEVSLTGAALRCALDSAGQIGAGNGYLLATFQILQGESIGLNFVPPHDES